MIHVGKHGVLAVLAAGYLFQDVPQVRAVLDVVAFGHHIAEGAWLVYVSSAYDTLKHL